MKQIKLVTFGFLLVSLLATLAPSLSVAANKRPYVLKHPGKEKCKPGYSKTTKKAKAHKKGKVVTVHETVCVPSTPTAPPAAPAPVAILPTATGLVVKQHSCELIPPGIVDRCAYGITVSITANGTAVLSPSPTPNLVFTNPGAPGESWTLPAATEVAIYAQTESYMAIKATAIIEVTINAFGEQKRKTIADIPGEAPWSVIATYGGSSTLSASSSPPQSLL